MGAHVSSDRKHKNGEQLPELTKFYIELTVTSSLQEPMSEYPRETNLAELRKVDAIRSDNPQNHTSKRMETFSTSSCDSDMGQTDSRSSIVYYSELLREVSAFREPIATDERISKEFSQILIHLLVVQRSADEYYETLVMMNRAYFQHMIWISQLLNEACVCIWPTLGRGEWFWLNNGWRIKMLYHAVAQGFLE